jgi:hypothetical protein
VLLQDADDLFVRETAALHSLILSMGQSLHQNGIFRRGKVSGDERGKFRPPLAQNAPFESFGALQHRLNLCWSYSFF